MQFRPTAHSCAGRDLFSARNFDFPGLVYDLNSAKAATEGIILLLTFTNHSEDDIADRFNCSLGLAEYVHFI